MLLTQFPSDEFGCLEVCAGGILATVCGNGTTDAVANVICRQLGHAALGKHLPVFLPHCYV